MKPSRIAALVILVAAAFVTGIWVGGRGERNPGTAMSERRVLHYSCPMHPRYVSDKPGDCPSCGMRLEPVFREEEDPSGERAERRAPALPPGVVRISPERQELIGVRIAEVGKSAGTRMLRTLGRVASDQTRLYVINATVDGWITSAGRAAPGSFVRKDEVLASFYSPEFLAAANALLFALSSMDRVQVTGQENAVQQSQLANFNLNLKQYKDALRNLGMGEIQIQRLIDTRKFVDNVDITSPAQGFILERKVSDGQRFNRGDEMYRIADLSRVWILVDIFEHEERYLKPGARVQVTLPNQGTTLAARVSDILPQFDPATRTLKVRLEAENPRFRLRPEMFVDIVLPVHYPDTITVPSEAVVDTGLRKIVFVDRGQGYFDRRPVETGWRSEGLVQITKGLVEGERIVISGNFLVDSESRMQLAASGLPEDHDIDPVCGMGIDPHSAVVRKTECLGKTYYFCSDLCKAKFDKNPQQYGCQESGNGDRTATARN